MEQCGQIVHLAMRLKPHEFWPMLFEGELQWVRTRGITESLGNCD
jgi:hypothetical protein